MLKILIFSLINLLAANVEAAPYIPSDPQQVLEKLPQSINSSTQLAQLRTQLSNNPSDIDLATQLAQLYIEQARQEGDPRFIGYAQAALAPWWKLDNPPAKVLILRATLLQSRHHFDLALTDLDALLALAPGNGQAWITRATILQVQGNYAQALKSCAQLTNLAPVLITLTCNNSIRHLNGEARQSYVVLKTAFNEDTENNPGIDIWILTLLAEMANRLGDTAAAEQHFLAAIKIEDPDSYLLGAYSDFLLDQKRAREVVNLLKTKTKIDPLLLRYAEALNLLGAKDAPLQIQRLKQTFAAASMRGDTVHQREQARFELRLMHNPKRALQLAKLNWQLILG
jgi:tetratricopeptide (TPR) repeat protein